MGFELVATGGTARHIQGLGIACAVVNKVAQGSPHVVDLMREGRIAMVINTPDAVGDRRLVFDSAHGAGDAAAVFHHDGGSAGRGRSNRGAEDGTLRGSRAPGLSQRWRPSCSGNRDNRS